MSREFLLFATSHYEYLQTEISKKLPNVTCGVIERKDFPDGEHYFRIVDDVVDRHLLLLGGTINDRATLELYDLASALVKYGARTLTIIVPYFGYSTMERAVRRGEVVTAKTRARLFSSIPSASFGNKIVCLDLHSEGLPHYFEDSIRPVHLYCKDLIATAIKELGGEDFVLGCTDAGRAKWVQSLANDISCGASFVFKRRDESGKTHITAVNAHVNLKRVVIFDDMVRSGGSLCQAARAYLEAGATSVAAVVTHAVLPGDALSTIKKSGNIDRLICTNSHPRALELNDDFLLVRSVSDVIVDFVKGTSNAMY